MPVAGAHPIRLVAHPYRIAAVPPPPHPLQINLAGFAASRRRFCSLPNRAPVASPGRGRWKDRSVHSHLPAAVRDDAKQHQAIGGDAYPPSSRHSTTTRIGNPDQSTEPLDQLLQITRVQHTALPLFLFSDECSCPRDHPGIMFQNTNGPKGLSARHVRALRGKSLGRAVGEMAWHDILAFQEIGDATRPSATNKNTQHCETLRAVSPQARQEFFNSGSRAGTLLRALRTVAALMHYVAGHQLMIMGRLLAEI
jgi:hypothetical protein